jgi:hypothetical protein
MQLIELLKAGPLFAIVVRFGLSCFDVRREVLVLIGSQGIRDLADFDALSLVADTRNVISVLSLLISTAISKKLWMRACFATVIDILVQFGEAEEVRDWMVVVVRRLLIFVALAHAGKKYRMRSVAICESLVALMQSNVSGLGLFIASVASSIAVKPMPAFFGQLFLISPLAPDDQILQEMDSFALLKLPLKTFPFDSRRRLIVAPLIRAPSAKGAKKAGLKLGMGQLKLPAISVRRSHPGVSPAVKFSRVLRQNR